MNNEIIEILNFNCGFTHMLFNFGLFHMLLLLYYITMVFNHNDALKRKAQQTNEYISRVIFKLVV